jgi:hypothetical protein
VAFCCSIYERVEVTPRDVRRLAKHFQLTEEGAKKRFTVKKWGGLILRRKKDALLGKTCRFLDPATRYCTIYEARPQACREYPGKTRCSYYEVLRFEREIQQDESIVPIIRLTFRKQAATKV